MSELFANRYRAESTRLPGWDYSNSGYYFVTIATINKEPYFGSIENNQITLSDMGAIARDYLIEIPQHYNNAIIDEYIIMPDHIHTIVIIEPCNCMLWNDDEIIAGDATIHRRDAMVHRRDAMVHRRDAINRVSTGNSHIPMNPGALQIYTIPCCITVHYQTSSDVTKAGSPMRSTNVFPIKYLNGSHVFMTGSSGTRMN